MVRPGSRRGVHVCVGVSRKGVVPEVGVVDDNFPFSFSAPIYLYMQPHSQTFHFENYESVCAMQNMATAIHNKLKRSSARA